MSQWTETGSEYTYEIIPGGDNCSKEGETIVASIDWGIRAGSKLKSLNTGPSKEQRRARLGWSAVSRRGSEVNLSV